MTKLLDLPQSNYVLPGNRACAGCGIGIGLRQITAALNGKAVMAVPASCLTVVGGMYPTSSVALPWVNVAFPSTAAAAAVEGNATLTHGRATDDVGYIPPTTVRQLAGTAMTALPLSAAVICRSPMPMPQPAHARLPGST